jgi:hypothetical protein
LKPIKLFAQNKPLLVITPVEHHDILRAANLLIRSRIR